MREWKWSAYHSIENVRGARLRVSQMHDSATEWFRSNAPFIPEFVLHQNSNQPDKTRVSLVRSYPRFQLNVAIQPKTRKFPKAYHKKKTLPRAPGWRSIFTCNLMASDDWTEWVRSRETRFSYYGTLLRRWPVSILASVKLLELEAKTCPDR